MSRLFVSLFLDEDVSVLIAKLVAARGFSALTTLEAGRLRSTDSDQLAFAAAQTRAILTHNRVHFESLAQQYIDEGRSHSGIIIAFRRPPHEIARRLLLLLNRITADEMDNQLLYI